MVSKNTTTDSQGKATLTDLVNGSSVPITISKEGYQTYSDTITVDKDNLEISATLTKITTSSQLKGYTLRLNIPEDQYRWVGFTMKCSEGAVEIDYGDGSEREETESLHSINHTYEEAGVYEFVMVPLTDDTRIGFDTDGSGYDDTIIGVGLPSWIDQVDMYDNGGFVECPNIVDYQLYWTENIENYREYALPNNTGAVFNIPKGTRQLYVDAGYPSEKLVERDD